MQAHPKDRTKKDHRGDPLERGRDLFDAYRPCYIKAFNDAISAVKTQTKTMSKIARVSVYSSL